MINGNSARKSVPKPFGEFDALAAVFIVLSLCKTIHLAQPQSEFLCRFYTAIVWLKLGKRNRDLSAWLIRATQRQMGPLKWIDLPVTAHYPKPNAKKARIRPVGRFDDKS
jgi:hypothetical protein